jgi:hypothetical protein
MGGYSSTYDGKQVEHILRNASCIKTTAVVANQWYAYVLGDDTSENIGSFSGTFSFQAKFTDESVEQLTIHVAATYDTSRSHVANVKILNHTTNGDEFKMTALGFNSRRIDFACSCSNCFIAIKAKCNHFECITICCVI